MIEHSPRLEQTGEGSAVMATVMDYLDWRGDLSFSKDPFNHVDNLILSELAYIDFDGIVPDCDSEQWVSIEDACDEYWRRHTEKEVQNDKTFFHLAPMLLKKIRTSPRFAGMQLSGYTNVVSAQEDEQMSAVTFRLKNGLNYVAYRGTDDTITGWKEDFNLTFMEESRGQRLAADYLSRRVVSADEVLFTGGHSKGGNFAVYASAFCDERVRRRISRVYTNDGPGFLESVILKEEYQQILPKVISIIPEESVIGLLLDCGYPFTVVKSNRKGLWQHDAMSWEVLGNHFVEVPSTKKSSVLMEKTVERWISGITMEERKQFFDTLFEIIESSGKDTVSSFHTASFKTMLDMMSSFQSLNNRDKTRMRDILQQLFRAGAEVLKQDIAEGRRLKPQNEKQDNM